VTRTSPSVCAFLISWMAPSSRNALSAPIKTRWRMGHGCVVPRAHVDLRHLFERAAAFAAPVKGADGVWRIFTVLARS
jgi:hypothetical protein